MHPEGWVQFSAFLFAVDCTLLYYNTAHYLSFSSTGAGFRLPGSASLSILSIIALLFFLPQVPRAGVVVLLQQRVVVETVEVVEEDETKNNRPFRLGIQIIIKVFVFILFTCLLMPTRFGRKRSYKKTVGRLQQALTSLVCKT